MTATARPSLVSFTIIPGAYVVTVASGRGILSRRVFNVEPGGDGAIAVQPGLIATELAGEPALVEAIEDLDIMRIAAALKSWCFAPIADPMKSARPIAPPRSFARSIARPAAPCAW